MVHTGTKTSVRRPVASKVRVERNGKRDRQTDDTDCFTFPVNKKKQHTHTHTHTHTEALELRRVLIVGLDGLSPVTL